MANIKVLSTVQPYTGQSITFKSPADCSQVTGLIVSYTIEENGESSMTFQFADAHGENVGDINHLFTSDVLVKVILDVEELKAYVQNADTNKYLEGKFEELSGEVKLRAPMYDYGETDLEAGVTPLPTGKLYLVYE